jgi:hypothetical protein
MTDRFGVWLLRVVDAIGRQLPHDEIRKMLVDSGFTPQNAQNMLGFTIDCGKLAADVYEGSLTLREATHVLASRGISTDEAERYIQLVVSRMRLED